MPDLLTHVLVAYVLATVLSWRVGWITPSLVTVAMVGALVPDFSRLRLVVPPRAIWAATGHPFSWSPLHQLGGLVLLALLVALLVAPRYRWRVLLLFLVGAGSHLLLDASLYRTTGFSPEYLWPLSNYRFAVDGFFRSYDRWPAMVATVAATAAWLETRRRDGRRRTSAPGGSPE